MYVIAVSLSDKNFCYYTTVSVPCQPPISKKITETCVISVTLLVILCSDLGDNDLDLTTKLCRLADTVDDRLIVQDL